MLEYVRRSAARSREEREDAGARRASSPAASPTNPVERGAHPDLGRRLRADGVRHRRDHGRARPRRARLRVRAALRAPGRAGRRAGRRRAARGGRLRRPQRERGAGQLGAVLRAAGARGRSRRSSSGWRSAAGPGRRSASGCATGASRASATGAARSRSSTATSCGIVPVPEDELPVLLPEVEDYRPSGKPPLASNEEWLHVPCPRCGGPGAARGRHDGHLRRLLLVLPALHRPAQRQGAVGPCDRRLLDAGRPVHRRHRPRHRAPALRALLHEGAERARPGRRPRAVRAPVPPGLGALGRLEDVEVARQRRPRRTSCAERVRRRRRAASTSCSWARPTRTWSGRRRASRASPASCAGCGGSSARSRRARRRATPATGRSRARRTSTIAKVTDDIEPPLRLQHADRGRDGAGERALARPARPGRALRGRDRVPR